MAAPKMSELELCQYIPQDGAEMPAQPSFPRRPKVGRLALWAANSLAAAAVFFAIQACDTSNNIEKVMEILGKKSLFSGQTAFRQPVTGSDPDGMESVVFTDSTFTPGGEGSTEIHTIELVSVDYTVSWQPPFLNLTNIRFDPAPSNPEGPPPYLWKNPVDKKVVINYNFPEHNASTGLNITQISYEQEGKIIRGDPVVVTTKVKSTRIDDGAPEAETRATSPLPQAGNRNAEGEYYLFSQFFPGEATMSPSGCQAISDALVSGQIFLAVQAPTVAVEGLAGGVRPAVLADRPPQYSWLEMSASWEVQAGFKAKLALAPRYANALETQFPSPEGKMWVPLAAQAPLVKDRCDIFPEFGSWSFLLYLLFEKSAENQVFPSYICYEGVNPFVLTALHRAARLSGAALVPLGGMEEPCITCLGPGQVSLKDATALVVEGNWFKLDAHPDGQRLAFSHNIRNVTETTDLRAEYPHPPASPLNWAFYANNGGTYDLAQPLTDVDANATVWVVSDPVTTAVEPGDYTFQVTAAPRSGAASAWSSNCVWIFPLRGDVNGDKAVNALDLALLAHHLAANGRLTQPESLGADYNQDSRIDPRDAILIQKAIVTR